MCSTKENPTVGLQQSCEIVNKVYVLRDKKIAVVTAPPAGISRIFTALAPVQNSSIDEITLCQARLVLR